MSFASSSNATQRKETLRKLNEKMGSASSSFHQQRPLSREDQPGIYQSSSRPSSTSIAPRSSSPRLVSHSDPFNSQHVSGMPSNGGPQTIPQRRASPSGIPSARTRQSSRPGSPSLQPAPPRHSPRVRSPRRDEPPNSTIAPPARRSYPEPAAETDQLEESYNFHQSWRTGPVDPSGILFDASDRNILCMDVKDDRVVVGSADHGLKVFNMNNGKLDRELYTKRYGHTEWVTCVQYLKDGRIVSGGMDSKLCLWDARGVRCVDLLAHTASISAVHANNNDLMASCSYDKTIRLWEPKRGQCVGTLEGHKSAVLNFVWASNNLLVSGDRDGGVRAWDVETGQGSRQLKKESSGRQQNPMTAIESVPNGQSSLIFTGSQDGILRTWDLRSGECAHQVSAHPGGAVTEIKKVLGKLEIVTAGADKKLKVWDIRASHAVRHTISDHRDFIYSLAVTDTLCCSGSGDGNLLVHDLQTGRCLYGLGANRAAVRCIACLPERLVAAGDDGKAIVYQFA